MDLGPQQQEIARTVLNTISGSGFALAGSGAIREHGLTSRPTEDIDLFTDSTAPAIFAQAVTDTTAVLESQGYGRAELFARLEVITSGDAATRQIVGIDLAADWRGQEPVLLAIGPVLALPDAVANKVGALFSRGEARDYLDVDSIRQAGRFDDGQLLELAANHDPGFDLVMFVERLNQVTALQHRQVEQYGIDADELGAIRQRLSQWAARLGRARGS